jgi:hypothetical protein
MTCVYDPASVLSVYEVVPGVLWLPDGRRITPGNATIISGDPDGFRVVALTCCFVSASSRYVPGPSG